MAHFLKVRLLLIVLFGSAFPTVLGDLASGMQPGEWKELQTVGLTKSFLETYGYNGANHSIVQYAAKAQWDPVSEQFLFFGSPHDNPYKFVIYDAQTNAWRLGPLPESCFNMGHNSGGCDVHSYYKSDLDQTNGKFYFFGHSRIQEYDIAGNTWTQLPGSISGYTGYGGLAYVPQANGLLYSGGWGGAWWYNKGAQAWSTMPGSPLLGSYHDFALYNPMHKMVLLGGGNGNTKILKMDSLRNVTQLGDSPYSIGTNNANIAIDPASGKYIVYKDGATMYEYEMTTDTWIPVSSLPPQEIRWAFSCNIAAASVWNHGVIMYLTHNPAKVYLYKHSNATTVNVGVPVDQENLISVYPNPFNPVTFLNVECRISNSEFRSAELRVYDIKGKLVKNLSFDIRSARGGAFNIHHSVRWDATGLPSGIYLLRVTAAGKALTKRLFLQR